jgi:hypothetical protein
MFGQGRPMFRQNNSTRRFRGQFTTALATLGRCALVGLFSTFLAAIVVAAPSGLLDQPIRLRIAWGGHEAVRWSGHISLDQGSLTDPQLLGMEADAAAAVLLEPNRIRVDTPRPHLFDGVDVTVASSGEAHLTVELKSAPDATPVKADVPLADAIRKPFHLLLDDRGSELVIQRAPNDTLRIVTHRDSMIFAPGEQFTFDVQPLLEEIGPGTTIDIEAKLTVGRSGNSVWDFDQRLPVPVDGPAVATLHVPLPHDEGVYQFHVAVLRPPGFRNRFLPGGAAKPLAERTFQVVVLNPVRTPPAADARWQTVLDIDPANPGWWDRLPDWTQVRRIPGLSKRPLGSTRANTIVLPLGNFVELPPIKAAHDSEPDWQAYPLPVEADGTPHMLEIEYPNDQEQQLGISILEPNAAGKLVPISRDSGVYVEGLGHAEQVETHKHRLVFWPRTNAPLLLVTNLHPTASARFGHIRVLKQTDGSIAANSPTVPQPSQRLVAAYIARPLVPETFGATEGLDTATGQSQSVDDWKTFYESATRLADYVSFAGYNAAAVSVLADGSATFPTAHILSTPMHNTALMVAGATDLPATDALELLFRVFDRSQLAIIPTLQFAAPLPELEALRQTANSKQSGLELIGPNGITWQESHAADHGLAPYYNPLDERVQRAILGVVHDLVDRYGRHSAFAGVAVQLSGNGYAMLPSLEWGLDDATITRFEHDTGIRISDAGENRFAARQALLTGEHANAWRSWRAAQMTNFYRQLATIVQAGDDKRRLLLTTEEMFSAPETAARMQPSVMSKLQIERAMLDLGIDRDSLASTSGIVVLPTRYVESATPLADRAIDVEINDAHASEEPVASATTGVMLYHRPQRQRLASFDVKSALDSYTLLVDQPSADGAAARQPYTAALHSELPDVILDGGELQPLGQEDATRHALRVLRQLPSGASAITQSDGCVTVRCYREANETVCLLINQCPWRADVAIGLSLPAQTSMQPLVVDSSDDSIPARTFDAGPQTWSLALAPNEVQAVRFASAGVKVDSVRGTISTAGRQELQSRLADLRNRDLTAPHVYTALANPGFEPLPGGLPLPGWQLAGSPGQFVGELDATKPKEGKTCLYMQNRLASNVAVVQSDPFGTPATGQLAMSVFLRSENLSPNSELRMVFETERDGQVYRRFARLSGSTTERQHLTKEWQYLAFGVNDLPLDSHGRMRIKFELTGAGEVWVDQVQLFDVLFPLRFYEHSEPELLELEKLRRSVESAQETDRVADCVQLLDGYWSRFLLAYTPVVQPMIATKPPGVAVKPPDGPRENPPTDGKPEDAPSLGEKLKHPSMWWR